MKKLALLFLFFAPSAFGANCFIESYSFVPGGGDGAINVVGQVSCSGADVNTPAKQRFSVSAPVTFVTTDTDGTTDTAVQAALASALATRVAALSMTLSNAGWAPSGRRGASVLGCISGVNLNAASTDTQLQVKATLYRLERIMVYSPSTTLAASAAQVAVFTAAAGGGVNVAPATGTALQALTNTGANPSYLDIPLAAFTTTRLGSVPTLFVRNTVAHGSAATVSVCALGIVIVP